MCSILAYTRIVAQQRFCLAGHPHHGRRQLQRQQDAVPASQLKTLRRAGDATAADAPVGGVPLGSRKANNSLINSSSGGDGGRSRKAVVDPLFHRRPLLLRRRTSSSPSRTISTGLWCGSWSCKVFLAVGLGSQAMDTSAELNADRHVRKQ